jgi:hypothetical protein
MFHALLGEPGAKGRDHLLQQDNNGLNLGLRMSEWKLLRLRNKGALPRRSCRKRSVN